LVQPKNSAVTQSFEQLLSVEVKGSDEGLQAMQWFLLAGGGRKCGASGTAATGVRRVAGRVPGCIAGGGCASSREADCTDARHAAAISWCSHSFRWSSVVAAPRRFAFPHRCAAGPKTRKATSLRIAEPLHFLSNTVLRVSRPDCRCRSACSVGLENAMVAPSHEACATKPVEKIPGKG